MENDQKNTPNVPKLVTDDEWLTSVTPQIKQRILYFQKEHEIVCKQFHSLREYASTHQNTGIHYNKESKQWIIKEWAPHAKNIELIGDFNQWSGKNHTLTQTNDAIWSINLAANTLANGELIKLRIHGADDSIRDRIPACITRAVQDPVTHDFSGQIWQPSQSYQWKHQKFDTSKIISPVIYEAHIGMSGEEPRLHSYREFADDIIPHISQAGYNTIQLMAVQEHPYYGSFGYHVSNFFAVCSRFGTPEDLKYLVDSAHDHGLAILLDIVHSHAVKNLAEGLNEFDGTDHQYFHAGERGNQPQWDSKCFNYGKPEVRRFLLSNIRYWLEEFKFDGFRFDGVTSMLYSHHGNINFDDISKYFNDEVDHDAILYLQLATTLTKEINPNAIIIAEDMSGMPGLCRPITEGGVGFTHRLNMGVPDYWIKILKESRDEDWNMQQIWHQMTDRRYGEKNICYAESHDQALVGDKTLAFRLMDKEMYYHMSLDDNDAIVDRGIALHKIIRLITFSLAGEGWLNFMGNEFGHPEWIDFPREGNDWSYQYCRRQWSLMHAPNLKYQYLANFDKELILVEQKHQLLRSNPAQQLWIHEEDKVLAYERDNLIFIHNLHPDQSLTNYRINVHQAGKYKVLIHTDQTNYGGQNRVSSETEYFSTEKYGSQTIQIYIPCRTSIVLSKA